MSNLNKTQFEQLCRLVFQHALDDVNNHGNQPSVLRDPENVSYDSFQHYVTSNHHQIMREPSVEMLTMALYKKAIDDIAFQADIFGFLLREIPIIQQRISCDKALADLKAVADVSAATGR